MKTILQPIANRDATGRISLPADGWIHLVPRGEYPATIEHPDGTTERVVQVVDDTALQSICNRFAAEGRDLLIDQEHWSYDEEKSTEAFGWVRQIENRAAGIFGRVDWTDLGKSAVESGRYRFISPAWWPHETERIGADQVRPTRLDTAGLTNRPNMVGMAPILSNRRGAASAGQPTPGAEPTQTQPTMKKVTSLLGLAEGADEEQIANAIRGIKDDAAKVPPLTNRVTELTTLNDVLVTEQINADLDGHGVKDDATRAALTPVLKPMKNRAERVDFLKLIGKAPATVTPQGKTPLTNRAAARTPDTDPANGGAAAADEGKDKTRAAAIRNRASAIARERNCNWQEAWNSAAAEIAA